MEDEGRWLVGRGEEGRLHFRDPCSGYTVIPRDVESKKRREGGRERREITEKER
jgi:hypothetical protein